MNLFKGLIGVLGSRVFRALAKIKSLQDLTPRQVMVKISVTKIAWVIIG